MPPASEQQPELIGTSSQVGLRGIFQVDIGCRFSGMVLARGMDMHRALNSGERRSCVYDVQNAVDCLVAACPQNRRAEDLLGTGVDQHLHKAFSLDLFEGTRRHERGKTYKTRLSDKIRSTAFSIVFRTAVAEHIIDDIQFNVEKGWNRDFEQRVKAKDL